MGQMLILLTFYHFILIPFKLSGDCFTIYFLINLFVMTKQTVVVAFLINIRKETIQRLCMIEIL